MKYNRKGNTIYIGDFPIAEVLSSDEAHDDCERMVAFANKGAEAIPPEPEDRRPA